MDKYQIGITTNSESTMHKLASTPITLECFEIGDYEPALTIMTGTDKDMCETIISTADIVGVDERDNHQTIISFLEALRLMYLETKDKRYWKELVRWLPESWLQMRTTTMNYENVRNICHQRAGHKLSEWNSFIEWAHTLPYAQDLIFD